MAPGTLELRLNQAEGEAIQGLVAPGDLLFCVLGVGSVRYRSNTKSPSLPEWKEKFVFTVGDETELVIECWKGSSSGEHLIAASRCPLDPVAKRPQGQLNAPMKDASGNFVMKINLFYRFAISGGAQHSSSAPSAPSAPPVEAHAESTSSRAGPFDGPNLSNPYGIPTGAPTAPAAYPAAASPYGVPAAAPGYPPPSVQPGYPPPAGSAPPYPPAAYPAAYPPAPQQQPVSALGGYPSAHTPGSGISPFPAAGSGSDPGKGKAKFSSAPAGGHYAYAPPPVPAGYGGGSAGSLPPSGYPAGPAQPNYYAQPHLTHPPAYYGGAGKPGKYKVGKQKKNKYSGYGMAAGGLAAGALAGVAIGSALGHHKYKGWGYKGPKWGFKGFKGPKWGFKGFKGPKWGFKGFKCGWK